MQETVVVETRRIGFHAAGDDLAKRLQSFVVTTAIEDILAKII